MPRPVQITTNTTAVQHMHACQVWSLTWRSSLWYRVGSVVQASFILSRLTGIRTVYQLLILQSTGVAVGNLRFTHADTCHPCVGWMALRLVSAEPAFGEVGGRGVAPWGFDVVHGNCSPIGRFATYILAVRFNGSKHVHQSCDHFAASPAGSKEGSTPQPATGKLLLHIQYVGEYAPVLPGKVR